MGVNVLYYEKINNMKNEISHRQQNVICEIYIPIIYSEKQQQIKPFRKHCIL